MTTPVLKLGPVLVASVESGPTDADLLDLQRRLVGQVGDVAVHAVIIDVQVVDVLDSFATRILRATAHMVQLRGAEAVVVGIQPAVALAMVQLGLTLDGVRTALDLEEGLGYLGIALPGSA